MLYNPSGRSLGAATAVDMVITFNDWASSSSHAMSLGGGSGKWSTTVPIATGSPEAIVYFVDGNGALDDDNNGGPNWSTTISECQVDSSVAFSPESPDGCVDVTVTYVPGTGVLKDVSPVYLHIGRNAWQDVIVPAPAMTQNPDGSWSYTYSAPQGTHQIDCVFHDGAGTWDNNGGNNWAVSVANCVAPPQNLCLAYGTPEVSIYVGNRNNIGENFDFNTLGGALSTVSQGGFGDFGQLYVNFDATNFYIGAVGCDVAGDNNAMVLFLGFNTLDDDAYNLWAQSGDPKGLDLLHNISFTTPMDVAILLGDEEGDYTQSNAPLGNGYLFGQGLYYLSETDFALVAGARLSQFDGSGTTPTTTTDDDPDRLTDRWEARIPWTTLNVTDINQLTSCQVAGVIASDSESGVDRYLSANYLADAASSDQPLDGFGNFGFAFVTITPIEICLDEVDSDNDTMPDFYEVRHGLQPDNPDDGDDDKDEDGLTNAEEHGAGTDPGQAGSVLEVVDSATMPTTSEGWIVKWPSIANKTYAIYRTSDMEAGFSHLVGGLTATPPENSYPDPTATGDGPYYYAVGVEE